MSVSLPPAVANAAWYASSLPEARRFWAALRDTSGSQERVLLSIVRRNARSEYGTRHRFAAVRSARDFAERVPLSTYEDYESDILRIAAGEPNVLTEAPVRILEPTSGSTGPTKLVPLTDSLRSEFHRAIAPWIADVFRHRPSVAFGKAYWSISPALQWRNPPEAVLPIGFDDDLEYLGPFQRMLAKSTMAAPSLVRLIDDINSFQYVTLLFLLRSRNLRMMSIWHPTFLTLLFERARNWCVDLAADIEGGTISGGAEMRPAVRKALAAQLVSDPARSGEIRDAFATSSDQGEANTRLWPGLRLISCWGDAGATAYLKQLKLLFPACEVQPKGLIATEGIVSLPLFDLPGSLLAVRSHYFEFLPMSDDLVPDETNVLGATQIEPGSRYSVVITTGGGLYRYRLGDVVEVVGRHRGCPLLKFVGRESLVSDRFGEKLNERHVRALIDEILDERGIETLFAMVAFESGPAAPAYCLFVEPVRSTDDSLRAAGKRLETALRASYQYRYSRELGQLAPLRVFRIDNGGMATYAEACRAAGQRAGDVKTVALHPGEGWAGRFCGDFLPVTD